jgi:hypothetical protein
MRSIARAVIAILMLLMAVSTASLAAPETGDEDETAYGFNFWSLREGDRFAKYYRAHARISPEPEPERRLANGIRWRLLVDERTGTRMPRITWMPNRQSMAAANDFLEMAHGAAIARADDFNRIWLGNNTIRRAVRGLPPYSPRPLQSDVELTYATSRFVNYIDLGFKDENEKIFNFRAGVRIFDIKKGDVYRFDLCPRILRELDDHGRPLRRLFNPGGPFAICNEAADDAFGAVVKRWALLAIPPEKRNGEPEIHGCSRDAHILARWDRPIVPYLTPSGLAILLSDRWPLGQQAKCRLAVGDPVIVPYRALKRFMRPGPLSDELLRLN